MPKPRTMSLRFPSLGIVRRDVYEHAASAVAYSCPWALNCRLEDSLTSRLRGGSFTAINAGSRPSEILYRDRVLTFSDNAITATRVGDHTDTALSGDVSDAMRPALFQLSEAGEVGEDVVALIPHKDMYLHGFAAGETWIQQGDSYTGTRRCVSREVGIIGADAWCVNHDTVYFLSSHGLYSVGADGSGLKALSEDKIPEDLTGVEDSGCTLTYNHADRGVYIHMTSGVSWFYDVERDQFWPFDSDSSNSHVLIGPLRIGGPNQLGLVQTLHCVTAPDSVAVTWRLIVGDSAEEASANGKSAIEAYEAGTAYDQYVAAIGALEAGRSQASWPRTRGAWAVVWLCSSATWAYERVILEVLSPFGRHRT